MSFRKSFGKYKQSVIEAESTWQIDCKKRKLLHNTFLFITTSNIMETMYYDDKGDNCECVIIGSSVKSIPEDTFSHFQNLHTVIFQYPSSLQNIGNHAFFNCIKLIDIKLPPSLKKIGDYAFSYSSLSRIIIPSSVILIGVSAFSYCDLLTDIVLPSSIQLIGTEAFYGCNDLDNVTIPTSVQKISKGTFKNCYTLQNIMIPSSVKTIENEAFENCHSLQSISLQPTLEKFGENVIDNCEQLWILHVPSIDNRVVSRRNNGWNITFDENLIFLCNSTRFPSSLWQWQPIMILHDIAYACFYGLEKNLNKDIQMKMLDKVFKKFFPEAVTAASIHQLTLLHILTHFPCSINDVVVDCAGYSTPTKDIVLNVMKDLLEKCPSAVLSMDIYGRTPIHHLFELNSRIDKSVVQLLIQYCDNTILHKAIESSIPSYNVIDNIVLANPKLLSSVDKSSGLLPFMTAALDQTKADLTIVYKLLQLKPDVLLGYNFDVTRRSDPALINWYKYSENNNNNNMWFTTYVTD